MRAFEASRGFTYCQCRANSAGQCLQLPPPSPYLCYSHPDPVLLTVSLPSLCPPSTLCRISLIPLCWPRGTNILLFLFHSSSLSPRLQNTFRDLPQVSTHNIPQHDPGKGNILGAKRFCWILNPGTKSASLEHAEHLIAEDQEPSQGPEGISPSSQQCKPLLGKT